MAGRGEVRFKLVAEVEQVKNALNEVKSQVSRLGDDLAGRLGPAGSIIQSLGPAGMVAAAGIGAAVASVSALAVLTKNLLDTGGALADMSAKAGISTDALQEYAYAASQVGVGQEQIVNAITIASQKIAEGGDQTRAAIEGMGLSFNQLASLDPERQFSEIVAAIQALPGPGQQAAAAMELFGKSGRELLPFIRNAEDLKRRAHELGIVLSGETASAADQLGDRLDDVGLQITAFKNAIAETVIKQPEVMNFFTSIIGVLADLIPLARDAGEKLAFMTRLTFTPWTIPEAMATKSRSEAFGASADKNKPFFEAQAFAEKELARLNATVAAEIKKKDEADRKAAEAALKRAKAEEEAFRATFNVRHDLYELANMGPTMEEKTIYELLQESQQRTGMIQTGPASLELSTVKQVDGLRELGRVIDENTGLWTRYEDVVDQEVANATDVVEEHAGAIQSALGAAFENLPQTILAAIQGGGDVGKSIGASLLGGLGQDLGKKLTEAIGGTLGKALGGLAGPLGSLAGGLLGGLADKLFKKEEMKVNDLRDAFFEAHGGWAALQKQLAALSNQDLVKKIFDATTVEQFNAAVREAEGLLGLQSEAQQKLQEAIDRYGFSIEELGPKYQQQKLDEMAGSLLQDFQLLTASGIEQATVLSKMGPAFQDYVSTALRAGSALPEAMRPIIEQLIQSGQLLDENGNAFTSLEDSGISFTQTLSEGLQSLIAKIDELVRALTGAGSAASRIAIPNGGGVGNGRDFENDPMPRSFAGGSGGFQNFGSGTPAVLHGVEAVVRPGDLRSIGGPNVTYAPVITVYGAGNADEIRDVVMTALRDNADGMRDYVASVAR